MGRELVLDVIQRSQGDGLKATARDLDDTADKADKASDKLGDLGKQSSSLDKEIEKVRTRIRETAVEIDKTGNLELLPQVGRDQTLLHKLERTKKAVAEIGQEAAKAGTTAGNGIVQGFQDLLDGAGPAFKTGLIAGLITIAAAEAPAIGGVLAGGIIAGLGGGVIAGGIALAARDSRVKDAAGDLKSAVMEQFDRAGLAFVGPVVRSLEILQSRVRGLDLAAPFEKVAPVLTHLADGFAGLVEEALPGFDAALEAAKPVLRYLGDELPHLGNALGEMLGDIASESDGAILALDYFFDLLEGGLRITGDVVAGLSHMFEAFVRGEAQFTGALEDLVGWVPLLGDKVAGTNDVFERYISDLDAAKDGSDDFSGSLGDLGVSADEATKQLEKMDQALHDLWGLQMSVDEATDNWQQSLIDLAQTLMDNGTVLTGNSQEALNNRNAIREAMQAALDHRDAVYRQTHNLGEANKELEDNIDQLIDQAAAAGVSRKELEAMAKPYLAIIDVVYTTHYKYEGVDPQHYLQGEHSGERIGELSGGRASGGPVMAGKSYLVGERGIPEVLTMGAMSGYVTPMDQYAAAMSGASGGSRGPVVNISWPNLRGDTFGDLLLTKAVEALQEAIRITPGLLSEA